MRCLLIRLVIFCLSIIDASVSQNVMTVDNTATATLQDGDNCPNETDVQNEPAADIEVDNQLVDSSGSQPGRYVCRPANSSNPHEIDKLF